MASTAGTATHRVPGEYQAPVVHALAGLMNLSLGNVGTTIEFIEPVEVEPIDQLESLRELTRAMAGGEVEVLLIVGGNPAYSAPADLEFARHLSNVGTSLRSEATTWSMPRCLS